MEGEGFVPSFSVLLFTLSTVLVTLPDLLKLLLSFFREFGEEWRKSTRGTLNDTVTTIEKVHENTVSLTQVETH